jgi:mRNA interferase RelE/StbE
MKYQVQIVRSAEKDMDKLPSLIFSRISRKILSLEDCPRPRGIKKLGDREEYRVRVGDYRVLYTIDDRENSITVLAVKHRRDVYR